MAIAFVAGCGRLGPESTQSSSSELAPSSELVASPALTFIQADAQAADDPTPHTVAKPPVRVASVRGEGDRDAGADAAAATVPDWAAEAIFYQLFPERFRNGDSSNDPTRESLEFPENVGDDWAITPWTSDWYRRAEWERRRGGNFYEDGVFDRRYGGDLQGVIDKLDYLDRLGVNALYLNPVFYARSLHKYDGNTFHHIDPYFGPDPAGDLKQMAAETSDPATWKWTAADRLFLDLVKQAHARGIRVVIDGVFNHTGRNFFAFEDLVENQADSPYRDWYLVQSFDDPATPDNEFRYKGWWGVLTLPEFADNAAGDDLHPGPKQYVFDATARWMDPDGDGDPSDGIDGWRLDVAAEVPLGFWASWNKHCRELNPECYTVAEHWDDAARFLDEGGFSATMNYHGFAFPVKGYLVDGTMSASDAGKELVSRMEEFPKARRYALQNLIDSHDTDRVASMIVNAPGGRPYLQPHRSDYDITERVSPRHWNEYKVAKPNGKQRRVQRLVALLQGTFVGPPMIYYGTESGMWGADDPCDRMPMVWDDLQYEPQQADPLGRSRAKDEVAFDHDLYEFFRALFALRRASPALNRGDFTVVAADDQAGALAFRRTLGDESAYVVLNRGENPVELRVPLRGEGDVAEVFVASGEVGKVTISQEGGHATVSLPGLDGVVLRQQPAAE